MKTQVYDRFGGGLLLLVMLTIAVVAGQAKPRIDAAVPTDGASTADAGIQITIDQERFTQLESLPSALEVDGHRPIRIEVRIEDTDTPLPDNADPSHLPVQ
jgi:hypothetical protein